MLDFMGFVEVLGASKNYKVENTSLSDAYDRFKLSTFIWQTIALTTTLQNFLAEDDF